MRQISELDDCLRHEQQQIGFDTRHLPMACSSTLMHICPYPSKPYLTLRPSLSLRLIQKSRWKLNHCDLVIQGFVVDQLGVKFTNKGRHVFVCFNHGEISPDTAPRADSKLSRCERQDKICTPHCTAPRTLEEGKQGRKGEKEKSRKGERGFTVVRFCSMTRSRLRSSSLSSACIHRSGTHLSESAPKSSLDRFIAAGLMPHDTVAGTWYFPMETPSGGGARGSWYVIRGMAAFRALGSPAPVPQRRRRRLLRPARVEPSCMPLDSSAAGPRWPKWRWPSCRHLHPEC